jgi:ribosomal-protein-alanine N-acetyltransferase
MIRVLHEIDLPELRLIEEATQITPWTEAVFQRCFEADYPGWIIEKEGKTAGFIFVSVSQVTNECHILNICVSPPFQHQGLGEKMLEFVIDWAKENGAVMVYLEVRRSNYRAIRLYEKANFKMIGERKGYYPSARGMEDALVFARDLGIEGWLEVFK